jgi:hypothetical protein
MFYPDFELLNNGAGFYTTQVFYDVIETDEKIHRRGKERRCVIIRLYSFCGRWVKRKQTSVVERYWVAQTELMGGGGLSQCHSLHYKPNLDWYGSDHGYSRYGAGDRRVPYL